MKTVAGRGSRRQAESRSASNTPPRGRRRTLSAADDAEIVVLRQNGASWETVSELLGVTVAMARRAVARSPAEILEAQEYRLRSGLAAPPGAGLPNSDNIATPDLESVPLEIPSLAAPTEGALGLLHRSEIELPSLGVGIGAPALVRIPEGKELRRQVANAINAQVTVALSRDDQHMLFWSPSMTDVDLHDWWARLTSMARGVPPWEALSGWPPILRLRELLDDLGVHVGIATLDISPANGRPGFHALLVVSAWVTPQRLDNRWSEVAGTREAGELWKRCRTLKYWDKTVAALKGLRNDLNTVRRMLGRGVQFVTNYILKGSDSPPVGRGSLDDKLLARKRRLPPAVSERAASDWLVYAAGITLRDTDSIDLDAEDPIASLVDVDLGELITARLASVPSVSIKCATTEACDWCCKPLRPLRRKPIGPNPPGKLRKLRDDRLYCDAHCKMQRYREWIRILLALRREHSLETAIKERRHILLALRPALGPRDLTFLRFSRAIPTALM